MPQEFLRDVLRTGDGAGQRRRLSILPLSIAGHAIVLGLFLLSPWAGALDLPVIASPFAEHYMETVAPPAPPAPSSAPQPTTPPAAPITAPSEIGPEPEVPPATTTADGGLPAGPGVNTGAGLLSDENLGSRVTPVAPPPPPEPTPRLVRVGGKIREPRKLVHVAPIYPELARQTRVQGAVTLEAILDATGKVESVRVLESVALLDDAAVRAVRQWRYTPTELNGVPVPVLMTITIRFSLDR
jgi:protein TonB